MCKHFALKQQDKSLLSEFPNYQAFEELKENVFANDLSYVLMLENNELVLKKMRFGFFHMDKIQLNARKETVHEKVMFAPSFSQRRCVIPCSFFYEEDSRYVEHMFYGENQPLLFLAGIYKDDRFVILTQKGDDTVSFYHPRMPLCVKKEDIRIYLDARNSEFIFSTLRKVNLVSPDSSEQLSLF